MEENIDLGREIIKDIMLDVDETDVEKLLNWIKKERLDDAVHIGFQYNDLDEDNGVISKGEKDKFFGLGYICAIRHMLEQINKE